MHGHDAPPGGLKHHVAEFLENHLVETFIVVLVFVDIALVTIEAGIDGNLLCINGEEVPFGSPAGQHLAHSGGHHGGSFLDVGNLGLASSSGAAVAASRVAVDLLGQTALGLPSLEMLIMGRSDLVHEAMEPIQAEPKFDGEPARGIVEGQRPNSHYQRAARRAHQEDHGGEPAAHSAEIRADDEPHAESAHAPAHGGGAAEHGTAHEAGVEHQPDVLVCEGAEGHTSHHIVHTCHTWSIIILSIFAVEIILKIWSVPGFLNSPFHKLDCAVVFLSLAVDTIVMWYIEKERQRMEAAGDGAAAEKQSREQREQAEIIGGLLVASRVWRVVRIAHGLFEQHMKAQEMASAEHSPHGHDGYEDHDPPHHPRRTNV